MEKIRVITDKNLGPYSRVFFLNSTVLGRLKMADLIKPSPEWVEDCLKWRGHVLTGKKAHWCSDWDDLPMDETCLEYKKGTCHCFEEDENES